MKRSKLLFQSTAHLKQITCEGFNEYLLDANLWATGWWCVSRYDDESGQLVQLSWIIK